LPTGCYLRKKAAECCKVVECDSGTFVSSTTNLNSLANGGGIYIKNPNGGGSQFVTPTMPSGGTPAPGSGGTGNAAPTLSMCPIPISKDFFEDPINWYFKVTYSVLVTIHFTYSKHLNS
jgi:hypothetical protein